MDRPISASCQIKNIYSFYDRYLGDHKCDGTFVEVGAFDGYEFSMTWGLAEMGWRGIYFEPNPIPYQKCIEVHKNNNVEVFNIAIGDKIGKTPLYLHTCSSTINKEAVDLSPWDFQYDRDNAIEVDVLTLTEALRRLKDPIKTIDLLIIDVEGAELQVLKGYDFINLPRMMIIETHEGHTNILKQFNADKIIEYVQQFPYQKIFTNTIDSIFVREDLL